MRYVPREIPEGDVIEQMFYGVDHDFGPEEDPELYISIPMGQYRRLRNAVYEQREERDRARRLAAKLEEVVAARNVILRALVVWYEKGEPGFASPDAIAVWAKAQLEEVP